MPWLKNCWYQVAWGEELSDSASLARTVLDTPLLLFRDAGGAPAILRDTCPHRFAPLSAGRVAGGVVRCNYHGLVFGSDGRCVHNPHGPVTGRMRTTAYPVVERHGAIWVWLGEADAADPALVPDLAFLDRAPPQTSIRGHMPTACNYQLLTDNILDLSHTDYLHPDTLGGMMTGARTTVQEAPGRVAIEWFAADREPSAAYRALLPGGARADKWIEVAWTAPAILVLRTATTAAGVAWREGDLTATVHSMTPETRFTTHYFYNNVRYFRVDDATFHAALGANIFKAFALEDKPMLEMQQARMGTDDLLGLKPLLLPIDSAAIRVRRQLAAMIAAEQDSEPVEVEAPQPA
ncbi:aromatic ring-hydroxylating dioxygenase subunit alpha [Sphingomonas naphthae]|uniref:Aromatic ring-hydroxylating dioxygenase subunit alpha n=1 Tax=Sphingomonas naphthae TaxID=1813468 RepID=A0ABY7TQ17_9SPHN|nr:aromatic ring-hydroxylating dioxygenase subunit alpha [Sphingomonas naphthae]WCT75128.1 aromatic ring-hydroxylating dioxygenase subunit alpha [Sphingomonas naphthae]